MTELERLIERHTTLNIAFVDTEFENRYADLLAENKAAILQHVAMLVRSAQESLFVELPGGSRFRPEDVDGTGPLGTDTDGDPHLVIRYKNDTTEYHLYREQAIAFDQWAHDRSFVVEVKP